MYIKKKIKQFYISRYLYSQFKNLIINLLNVLVFYSLRYSNTKKIRITVNEGKYLYIFL